MTAFDEEKKTDCARCERWSGSGSIEIATVTGILIEIGNACLRLLVHRAEMAGALTGARAGAKVHHRVASAMIIVPVVLHHLSDVDLSRALLPQLFGDDPFLGLPLPQSVAGVLFRARLRRQLAVGILVHAPRLRIARRPQHLAVCVAVQTVGALLAVAVIAAV